MLFVCESGGGFGGGVGVGGRGELGASLPSSPPEWRGGGVRSPRTAGWASTLLNPSPLRGAMFNHREWGDLSVSVERSPPASLIHPLGLS